MKVLATLAKTRLTLADYNNIYALQIQEYYAKELRHKNKVDGKIKKTYIQMEQIVCGTPQLSGKLIWEITFLVKLDGYDRSLVWGKGYVNIKNGNSELLLDNRPWAWTGTSIIIGKEEIQLLSLPDKATITIADKQQKASFTKIALQKLEEEYRKYTKNASSRGDFDGYPEVYNFGGWLKDMNKKIFIKNYAVLKTKNNMTEQKILQEAYLKTPFGEVRHQLGITEFEITCPQDRFLSLSEIMKKDDWKESDEKEMIQAGTQTEQWSMLKVPDIIIVNQSGRQKIRN